MTFSPRVDAAEVVSGNVVDAQAKPVVDASVQLTGAQQARTRTDVRGHFTVSVEGGSYRVTITAPHFRTYRGTLTVGSEQGPLHIVLQAPLASPPVIGSVTGHGRAPFNSTPVSQKVFPREAYRDQGQPSTSTVLDQTPGAFTARNVAVNGAAPLAPSSVLVRGGLPFETPALLGGALVSLPSSGTFDLSLIPTYVLQEVEIVKGPGDVAGAGGGVNGAINLRTAEPTAARRALVEFEGDSRGGQFSDLGYDGTLPGGKFAFATMASVDGAPGPLADVNLPGPVPSSALRKSLLLTLRATPSQALSVTGTFLGVNLNRALTGTTGVFDNGTFAALTPSIDSWQDERLRFEQVLAHADSGSDGFDLRLYGLDLAQNMTSGGTGIIGDAYDRERGEGLAWQHQADRNLYTLSVDALQGTASDTDAYDIPLAAGSASDSTRFRASAALHPTGRDEIDASFGGSHLAIDGHSWTPANARLALAHTITGGVAVRASFGTSAVTPPLDVLSASAPVLRTYIGFPSQLITFQSNVSDIERASGGDVGVEWRMHGNTTTLSADWYESATHGAYILEREPTGAGTETDTWFNGPSMIDSGVELSLQQFKPIGFGFITQIAFPRTYVVGPLPANFYANGNLAILPGQNIAGGAFFVPGENDVAPLRVPYAQGYAEISYKWPRGSRLSLGALYEGNNNAYGVGAFTTFNSNLELSLGARSKLQISAENIFDVLDNRLPIVNGGIPVPLVNGAVGLTNANALAPSTIRFMLRRSFGEGSLYEH